MSTSTTSSTITPGTTAPDTSTPILLATDLRSSYGDNLVLRGAEFRLDEGSICGVIGPNGAGKTTLLRTMYGLLPMHTGQIAYDGRDIGRLSSRERLLAGICYVPQERNVFPNLSVAENLALALSVLPAAERKARLRDRLDYVYGLFPRLAERRGQAAGLMSGGEQRMVAIGIGLMAEPRVLLLDEPTTGLAPLVLHQLMGTIQDLNRQGISTLIVEQNVISLLQIVAELYLVKGGRCTRYPGDPRSIGEQKIWEYM
jgi:branched-chain amino acid transport system ATP-binding protein